MRLPNYVGREISDPSESCECTTLVKCVLCLPRPFLWIHHHLDYECVILHAATSAANVQAKPAHIRIAMDCHKYLNRRWYFWFRRHPNYLHSDRNYLELNWPHYYSTDQWIDAESIVAHRKWLVENHWFVYYGFLLLNCNNAPVH